MSAAASSEPAVLCSLALAVMRSRNFVANVPYSRSSSYVSLYVSSLNCFASSLKLSGSKMNSPPPTLVSLRISLSDLSQARSFELS